MNNAGVMSQPVNSKTKHGAFLSKVWKGAYIYCTFNHSS
jgi:hypothetical protein